MAEEWNQSLNEMKEVAVSLKWQFLEFFVHANNSRACAGALSSMNRTIEKQQTVTATPSTPLEDWPEYTAVLEHFGQWFEEAEDTRRKIDAFVMEAHNLVIIEAKKKKLVEQQTQKWSAETDRELAAQSNSVRETLKQRDIQQQKIVTALSSLGLSQKVLGRTCGMTICSFQNQLYEDISDMFRIQHAPAPVTPEKAAPTRSEARKAARSSSKTSSPSPALLAGEGVSELKPPRSATKASRRKSTSSVEDNNNNDSLDKGVRNRSSVSSTSSASSMSPAAPLKKSASSNALSKDEGTSASKPGLAHTASAVLSLFQSAQPASQSTQSTPQSASLQPVPQSVATSQPVSQPVPVSASQPVPISVPQPVPVSASQPVSVSQPVPISASQPVSVSVPQPVSASQPVPVPQPVSQSTSQTSHLPQPASQRFSQSSPQPSQPSSQKATPQSVRNPFEDDEVPNTRQSQSSRSDIMPLVLRPDLIPKPAAVTMSSETKTAPKQSVTSVPKSSSKPPVSSPATLNPFDSEDPVSVVIDSRSNSNIGVVSAPSNPFDDPKATPSASKPVKKTTNPFETTNPFGPDSSTNPFA